MSNLLTRNRAEQAAIGTGTTPPMTVVEATARRKRDNEVVTDSDGRFKVKIVVNKPRDRVPNKRPNACRCLEIDDAKYVAVFRNRTFEVCTMCKSIPVSLSVKFLESHSPKHFLVSGYTLKPVRPN